MNIKAMIDGQIIYDVLRNNDNCEESLKILDYAQKGEYKGYVSCLDLLGMSNGEDSTSLRNIYEVLNSIFTIVDLKWIDLKRALKSDKIGFGVKIMQAKRIKADILICRDAKKHIASKIEVVEPKEFIRMIENGKELKQKKYL